MSDSVARQLRGKGVVGVLVTILIPFAITPLVSAGVVLLWAWRSKTPLSALGFTRPKRLLLTITAALLSGIALKLIAKAVVMPLLGADPVNQHYHYLAGNPAALPGILFAVIVGAGFGEETVYRGFLFERFRCLFGRSALATTGTVLVTSLWFAAMHYQEQGLAGVQQAVFTGLVFGTTFALTGELLPIMIAHAAFDVTAVALIYWGLETRVAHWIIG
jgi:membrane protease YdiL (CAAX protease family)